VDNDRAASPSEAIIDSQSVKSAAMVSESVGFDAGKLLKGRKRFLSVDTLGLVLRVLVTAASVGEREGGKRVFKRVKRMGKDVSRLHPFGSMAAITAKSSCTGSWMCAVSLCRLSCDLRNTRALFCCRSDG
jgi:hypothetical protein